MKLAMLSEATLDDIHNRIPILIAKYLKGMPDVTEYLSQIASIDPTRGKYVEWLLRQFKAGRVGLEDVPELRANLVKFDKVKDRLESSDISKYTPSELARAILPFETSARQEKLLSRSGRLTVPPGSKLVIDKSPYQVVEVTEPTVAQKLSSGTKWCTATWKYATQYLMDGPLYFIYKNGIRYALMHSVPFSIKNIDNEAMVIDDELYQVLEPIL